jgi:hypothetical protein
MRSACCVLRLPLCPLPCLGCQFRWPCKITHQLGYICTRTFLGSCDLTKATGTHSALLSASAHSRSLSNSSNLLSTHSCSLPAPPTEELPTPADLLSQPLEFVAKLAIQYSTASSSTASCCCSCSTRCTAASVLGARLRTRLRLLPELFRRC